MVSVATFRGNTFSAHPSGCAFLLRGKIMRKKQIIDITGTQLTPSRQGKRCLGNGEHPEYECCCENCNYYLRCFPQYKGRLIRNILKNVLKN